MSAAPTAAIAAPDSQAFGRHQRAVTGTEDRDERDDLVLAIVEAREQAKRESFDAEPGDRDDLRAHPLRESAREVSGKRDRRGERQHVKAGPQHRRTGAVAGRSRRLEEGRHGQVDDADGDSGEEEEEDAHGEPVGG